MSGHFDMLDSPSGQHDSVVELVVPLLPRRSQGVLVDPLSIIWVDRLLHSFAARKPVTRITSEDSISLIRPIENCRVIVGRGTGVTQRLRFGQIGFTAA